MTGIYIIGGMMGAGKTTFIKYLSNELKDFFYLNHCCFNDENNNCSQNKHLNELLSDAIRENNYHLLLAEIACLKVKKVIIELNGITSLAPLMAAVMQTNNLFLAAHAYVLDVNYIDLFFKTYHIFFKQQLFLANTFVLTNYENLSAKNLDKVKAFLQKINDEADIICCQASDSLLVKKLSNNVCDCLECLDFGQCNYDCQRRCLFFKPTSLEKPFVNYHLTSNKTYTKSSLITFLKSLPSDILRCQGVAEVDDEYFAFDYLWQTLKVLRKTGGQNTYFEIISNSKIKKENIISLFS